MLRADVEKVFIEHCVSCKSHHWCTNHDEDKYKEYYSRCQAAISRGCFNVTVVENQIPDGFTDQFITDPNLSKPGKFHFPRIGSFEVYFRGVCVFSKINSMKWPKASKVAEKVREIQDTPQAEGRKKSKVKRVKSAYPGKKRKVRKIKKKGGKKKENLGTREGLSKYVGEKKKEGGAVNYAELFKDPHSRSSSESDRKNSDSEQPVPPYEYYRAQPKAKTPPKQLDSFGNNHNEYQKQPSPPKPQPTKPEVQNPVRQVKKVEKYSSSSSSSSSKFKHKSETPDYSSESYESNPQIEKIDFASHLKRTEEQPKIDKSSSSAEYNSSDYDEYQSSSKSSKKPETPKKPEKKSSDSSDYKEDYEQSSNSSSSHKHLTKKPSSSSSTSNKPVPKPAKKSSSSSDSSPKHLKKSSSSDSEKEDYDQDFEDQEEEVHPLRKVDKSYPVTLPLGQEVRKKITYENMSKEDTEFTITTSHPDYMSVKEDTLLIEKDRKEKIQLRFAPIFTENEKKYYIYIDKGSVPWECIEIVAQYE